ncbi:hypothetical protein [Halocalculus aciditolerans]|uniref:Uncharacterized protein n=1 Tax=Halocalculus aciditolerans TaxID=1383812 RepID=A0A830F393_9EURY|nr:hypothetical protein [Halocalculus aciditolerans]GGL58556.1 hypothetical protein GCM10009039_15980 [Halocalculus aciditolerans]
MATITSSVVLFVIGLLVGGFGVYVGARFITGTDDYTRALVTAAVGALAWAVFSWVPVVGGLLALVAYVWVIKWRYAGGWVNAALIALVAWIATVVVVFVLSAVAPGLVGDVVGVPGV